MTGPWRIWLILCVLVSPADVVAGEFFSLILPKTTPPPPEVKRLIDNAQAQMDLDFRADSIRTLRQAVEVHRGLVGNQSPDLIPTLENLADTEARSHEVDAAVQTHTEIFRLASENFPKGDYRIRSAEHGLKLTLQLKTLSKDDYLAVVKARDKFGEIISSVKPKLIESIPLFEQQLQVFRQHLGGASWECRIMRGCLASCYASQGRHEQAVKMIQQDLDSVRQAFGDDHPYYGQELTSLSGSLSLMNRHKESIEYGEQAIRIFDAANLTREVPVTELHTGLVNSYVREQRFDDADRTAIHYLSIIEQTSAPESLALAEAVNLRAQVAVSQKNDEKALPQLLRLVELRRRNADGKAADLAIAQFALADIHLRRREFAAAEPLLTDALTIYKNTDQERGKLGRSTVTAHRLAEAYLGQSKFEEAIPLLQTALRRYRLSLGAADPETRKVRELLALALRSTGRDMEADALGSEPRPFLENASDSTSAILK